MISRRKLFSTAVMKELLPDWLAPGKEKTEPNSLDAYFQSPLTSYPLLQEMPWPMLLEEAQRRGIEVEGRTKNDIVRDIFRHSGREAANDAG